MEYVDFLRLAETYLPNRVFVGKGNASLETYKDCVTTLKKDNSGIVAQYGLTDSELFVMFMMTMKNYSDIQEQFFFTDNANPFTKACATIYDSFLEKMPRSSSRTFYRRESYYQMGTFRKGCLFRCKHFLTASTSREIFDKRKDGIKLVIDKRIIGETNAHEIFSVFNGSNEFQVNFERETIFRVDEIDIKGNKVYLIET